MEVCVCVFVCGYGWVGGCVHVFVCVCERESVVSTHEFVMRIKLRLRFKAALLLCKGNA